MIPTRDELEKYVGDVQADVAASAAQFVSLQPPGVVLHPIPFFGDPTRARVATVGVNPSAGEFVPARRWPRNMAVPGLTGRLVDYFDHEIPSHPWFASWKQALGAIDASYKRDSFHIDLSPRATKSMGILAKEGKHALFLQMVHHDAKHLCRLLRMCPAVRAVLAAGAVTNRLYIVEFLQRLRCRPEPVVRDILPFERRPGVKGNVGLYEFEMDGVIRLFFFCASGPADRVNRGLLVTRVREHADEIRRRLE